MAAEVDSGDGRGGHFAAMPPGLSLTEGRVTTPGFTAGGLFITPVDELTGLPYCFAPTSGLPSPRPRFPNYERRADWNHQFPRFEAMTQSPPWMDACARMALLSCRVQWVDFNQHHEVYNNRFAGPPQPQTPGDLFRTLIMAEAGYIPERALDLSGEEPAEVGLTRRQRQELWSSGQVQVRDPAAVRSFLRAYVLGQSVDHVERDKIEDFLYTGQPDLRRYLGHALAAVVVERAVEPVDEVYRLAHRQGLLAEGSPTHIRDFVKPRLAAGSRYGRVLNSLQGLFAGQARGRGVWLAERGQAAAAAA